MGDYRNLKRALCFNRALHKYNKKSIVTLRPSNVFVLLLIYDLSKYLPCTTNTILKILKKVKHTYSSTVINDNIKLFMANGWVKVSNTYPSKYSLTIDGINLLNALERRVRNERTDK